MEMVNEIVNEVTAFMQSGNMKTALMIAVVVLVVMFVIRGVSRVAETLVLGGLTIFGVYYILEYLGIEVDTAQLLSSLQEGINAFIAFFQNLPTP